MRRLALKERELIELRKFLENAEVKTAEIE